MTCPEWKERLLDHLYGELNGSEGAALQDHLAQCDPCRRELSSLRETRGWLREAEIPVPVAPRVLVMAPWFVRKPALAFAAGLASAALLIGAGAGAGWALRGAGATRPASSITLSAEDFLRRDEFERRLGDQQDLLRQFAVRNRSQETAPSQAARTLTREDLENALTRFEKKLDVKRAGDLNYLLHEIAVSELRSGVRIGETRDALRYVAMDDPKLSPQ
jgi:hypothetical protein